MSTNLCSSFCRDCGKQVRLSDLRGKPIEFRRTGSYAPEMGCRWDCPCGQVYFVIWRRKDTYWGQDGIAEAHLPDRYLPDGRHWPNQAAGRFYIERDRFDENGNKVGARREETGTFTLDLAYYCTFRDEDLDSCEERENILSGKSKPWRLCEDNAASTEWTWGRNLTDLELLAREAEIAQEKNR